MEQRLRTVTVKTRTAVGGIAETAVPRVSYRECLTPVRAFYLDLACWAVEDPARWGPWVVPCSVGSEEIDRRKDKRRRKARMDARTRERLRWWPPPGRSGGHQRAVLTTAPGQFLISLDRNSAAGHRQVTHCAPEHADET